jgi:hypothetical protein
MTRDLHNFIASQQAGNFRVIHSDMGEVLYEWIDDRLEGLSSVRLADILRLARHDGINMDSHFLEAVKQALEKRGHYQRALNWQQPH